MHSTDTCIADNVRRITDQIAESAQRTGRSADEVRLMAVAKTRTPEEIDAVIRAGITLLGENRVQEAQENIPQVNGSAEWHMIGHLQSNKAGAALELFSTIQSVDTLKIGRRLDRLADSDGKTVPVLLEVNTSGEESKYGFHPDRAVEAYDELRDLPALSVQGFMTIGIFTGDEAKVRGCFESLRRIRDDARALHGDDLPVLSMGMTNDFEWAVEEGSTLVRIGTAIFGERRPR